MRGLDVLGLRFRIGFRSEYKAYRIVDGVEVEVEDADWHNDRHWESRHAWAYHASLIWKREVVSTHVRLARVCDRIGLVWCNLYVHADQLEFRMADHAKAVFYRPWVALLELLMLLRLPIPSPRVGPAFDPVESESLPKVLAPGGCTDLYAPVC